MMVYLYTLQIKNTIQKCTSSPTCPQKSRPSAFQGCKDCLSLHTGWIARVSRVCDELALFLQKTTTITVSQHISIRLVNLRPVRSLYSKIACIQHVNNQPRQAEPAHTYQSLHEKEPKTFFKLNKHNSVFL